MTAQKFIVVVVCVISLTFDIANSQSYNVTLRNPEELEAFGFACIESTASSSPASCNFLTVPTAGALPSDFPNDFKSLPGSNLWYPNSSAGSPQFVVSSTTDFYYQGYGLEMSLRYYCSRAECCRVGPLGPLVPPKPVNSSLDLFINLPATTNSEWGEHTFFVPQNAMVDGGLFGFYVGNGFGCYGLFQTVWIHVVDTGEPSTMTSEPPRTTTTEPPWFECTHDSDCPSTAFYCDADRSCQCRDQFYTIRNHDRGTCDPIPGSKCHLQLGHPEYAPCAGNSTCVFQGGSDPTKGECKCNPGMSPDTDGMCTLDYGQPCFYTWECNLKRAFGCRSNLCQCSDRGFVYRSDIRQCVATEGNMCGNVRGWHETILCDVMLECVTSSDSIQKCQPPPPRR